MLTAAARAQCTSAFPNGTTGLQCQSFGATPPCVAGEGKFFHEPFTGLNRRDVRYPRLTVSSRVSSLYDTPPTPPPDRQRPGRRHLSHLLAIISISSQHPHHHRLCLSEDTRALRTVLRAAPRRRLAVSSRPVGAPTQSKCPRSTLWLTAADAATHTHRTRSPVTCSQA